MVKDSTEVIFKILSNIPSISIWFWIAMLEFIWILWLLLKTHGQKRRKLDFSEMKKPDLKKSGSVDMPNLMNSLFHSEELYKELSRKCHPDRFVNTPEQEVAEDIFQRISRNRRNYKQLVLIKEEAQNKLKILEN